MCWSAASLPLLVQWMNQQFLHNTGLQDCKVPLSPIICMYSENLILKSLNGTFDCNYILSSHISHVSLADNTFKPFYPYSSFNRIWELKRCSSFIVSSNPIMPTKNQTLLFLCINVIFWWFLKFISQFVKYSNICLSLLSWLITIRVPEMFS